jgi:hypothetical protein
MGAVIREAALATQAPLLSGNCGRPGQDGLRPSLRTHPRVLGIVDGSDAVHRRTIARVEFRKNASERRMSAVTNELEQRWTLWTAFDSTTK